jgi:hypothetical protein
MENYNLAEQFSPGRNEHYMYLCYYLEEKNMLEEILEVIDIMKNPQRRNPFPNYSYLIEGKCYTDTSNFLIEYKDKIENKIKQPTINLDSIKFDFN